MRRELSYAAHGLRQIIGAFAENGGPCPPAKTLRRKMMEYGYGSAYGAAWCELVDNKHIDVQIIASARGRVSKVVTILTGSFMGRQTRRPLRRRTSYRNPS